VPYPFSATSCTSPPEQQAGLVPFAQYFGASLDSLTDATILEVAPGASVLLDTAPAVQFGALVVRPGGRLVIKDSTCRAGVWGVLQPMCSVHCWSRGWPRASAQLLLPRPYY
jgi:hypothetical protein